MALVLGNNPNRKNYLWVQYVKSRITQNKNFLGFISGPTGSGKSWSAISMGELLDPKFSIDRIVFTGKELLSLINSGKLKKGSVIIWDEAGIDLSSRSWQSVTNKLLNFLLQTFRHKNFILIFTSPYTDFIDAGTRKLFHAEFETLSIDYKKQTTKLIPKVIQYNSKLKKFYYKYLQVATGDGVVKLKEWNIPKPSQELINLYEEKKNLFTAKLNQNIEMELTRLENKDKKPLTELQEKILGLWNKGVGSQKKIAEMLDKNPSQISQNVRFMLNKGYSKENIQKHR